MKRSITTWTTTIATAALLGLPGAAIAKPQQPYSPPREQQPAPKPTQPQQPAPQPTQPPTDPQPTQPTPPPTQPAPQPTQPQPSEPQQQPTTPPTTSQPQASAATGADQSASPEEHLRQAREALNSIKSTSIPASDRTQFAELRRHLAALDKPATASSTSSKTAASSAKADNWGTEVAAIDRIITSMAGSETTTGAASSSTTGATGTSGRSHSAALDEATRSKLMDIRTHITAYAAAKSGTASTPRSDTQMSAAANETPAAAQATAPAQTEPANPTPANPNAATPAPANPAQDTPAQNAATPQTAATAPKVDAEAAHRELLAARDALNQMTQLPAAAQLSGEARTQVQQLITNFNELITNTTDWRASYTKVESSLNAILGPSTSAGATDANPTTTAPANPANPANPTNPSNPANPTSPANPTTADNPTAVGTSGTAQLDPAIRATLMEMRSHLVEFQKASGGAEK